MAVTLVVGTVKGAFLLRSREERREWSLEGPIFKGWRVGAVARGSGGAGARTLLATSSFVYGTAIHASDDGLASWHQVERPPRWDEASGFRMKEVWRLAPAGDRWYAGVDEAGLFRSDDGGEAWEPVSGLTDHPTRPAWFPGFGGLCCHAVLVDPKDPDRLWVGISAVGVFRSEDGGASWTPRNAGVPLILEDEAHAEIGFCVHGLAADPADADRMWRQDHKGMFRTRDGGDSWERIENGLPSGFGFPVAYDARSGALFAYPLESDEYRMPVDGRMRVWRSTDGGDSWQPLERGLPEARSYASVLRAGLAVDGLDPCGVYVGTSSGTLHASADGGETWTNLPHAFPRILCVAALAGE